VYRKEVKMLWVIINDEGIVVDAKELLPNGQMREILYHKEETKSIVGSRLYTPNGCCWLKTPNGWKCGPCP
jgi:hypothetical protein